MAMDGLVWIASLGGMGVADRHSVNGLGHVDSAMMMDGLVGSIRPCGLGRGDGWIVWINLTTARRGCNCTRP